MAEAPVPVSRLLNMMAGLEAPWALCGGWAVDGWIGRQTRDHKDIDVSVYRDGLDTVFSYFAGWNLIAHDRLVAPDTTESWNGRPLELPAHIHARKDGWDLELLVDHREADEWLFSSSPRITRRIDECIGRTAWGVTALRPEVLLYYKATAYYGTPDGEDRPQDELDLSVLLPGLLTEQVTWLHQAIGLVVPGHPWLPRLQT